MDGPDFPSWLTSAAIATPLYRRLGNEDSRITNWTCHRLVGSGESLGVWRVCGHALAGGTLHSWSMILKGWAPPKPTAIASAWNWPSREVEMYRSGLNAGLPGGIQAPAYYGETRLPDGSVWVWLEAITEDTSGPWPPGFYAKAARHLGQLNGAYVVDRTLPEDRYVSRDWLRGWVEAAAPAMATLDSVANHPLVRQICPPRVIEAYTRIWNQRQALYDVLDRLPQTFCHLDAYRRNAFIRAGPNGADETILIDWGFAGIAGVGEELAPLVAGSACFMDIPVDDIRPVQDMVLECYVEGLRDAGWCGDPELVRTGYAVAAVLRYGIGTLRIVLPMLCDERLHPRFEQLMGQPLTGIVARNAVINDWLSRLVPEL